MTHILKVSWSTTTDYERDPFKKEFDTREQLALFIMSMPYLYDHPIILFEYDREAEDLVCEVEIYNGYRET